MKLGRSPQVNGLISAAALQMIKCDALLKVASLFSRICRFGATSMFTVIPDRDWASPLRNRR